MLGIVVTPPDASLLANLRTALLLTAAAAAGAALWGRRSIALLFILASFAAAGAILHTAAVTFRDPAHIVNLERSGGIDTARTLRLTGVIAAQPERRPDRLQIEVGIEELQQDGRTTVAAGRVLLNLHTTFAWSARDLPFRAGDRVRLVARLRVPRRPGNPGGFEYDVYLRRRGITHTGHLKSPLAVEILTQGHGPPGAAWLSSLRAALQARIMRDFSAMGGVSQRGALLQAMLLGQRGMISDETKHLLRRTGLFHIIAISGLHVWLLGFIVFIALRAVRLPDRAVALLTIAALALYWALAGGRSSASRACLVAIVFLLGRVFYRKADMINNLAFAAFLILAFAPTELYSLGFQLTFSAALSICLLYPVLNDLFEPLGWIGKAFAVSFAALFGTLPLSAAHFNIVTLHGGLTTTLLIPAITLLLILGFFYLLISGLLPFTAGLLSSILDFLIGVTLEAARLFDRLLPAAVRIPAPPTWLIIVYYAALLTATLLALRTKRRLVPLLPFLVVLALLVWNPFVGPPTGTTSLHAIDVGQGESLLLELPDGSAALIDGGGAVFGGFDVGEQIVSDFLWHRGHRHLDLMISTHSDSDHLDGLLSVARNFPVRELWITGAAKQNERFMQLMRTAEDNGTRIRRLSRGDRLAWRGTTWVCFNPPGIFYRGRNSSNANSLVTLLQADGHRILLTGDAGERQLDDIAGLYGGGLRCEILKVPHHGSDDALSRRLLDLAHPSYAAICAGNNNIHGFPRRAVLNALKSRNIKIFRTDLDGAVSFTLSDKGVSISTGRDNPAGTAAK